MKNTLWTKHHYRHWLRSFLRVRQLRSILFPISGMLFSAAMKNRKYLFSFSDDEISSSPSKARHSRQKKIVSSKHSLFQISEVKTTIMPLQQPSFLDLEPIPLSGWSSSVQDHDTQTRNDRPLPSSVIGALDEAIQLFGDAHIVVVVCYVR